MSERYDPERHGYTHVTGAQQTIPTRRKLPHIYFNRRMAMWLYRHPCSLDLSAEEQDKLCAFCIAMDGLPAEHIEHAQTLAGEGSREGSLQ